MAEAARLHGLQAEPEKIIPFIGAPMNILVAELYGVSPDAANAVSAEYMRLYEASYIQRTPPLPGARALLDALRAAGLRLAVVPNNRDEGAPLLTEVEGCPDL